jgi:hypothetical protein
MATESSFTEKSGRHVLKQCPHYRILLPFIPVVR